MIGVVFEVKGGIELASLLTFKQTVVARAMSREDYVRAGSQGGMSRGNNVRGRATLVSTLL